MEFGCDVNGSGKGANITKATHPLHKNLAEPRRVPWVAFISKAAATTYPLIPSLTPDIEPGKGHSLEIVEWLTPYESAIFTSVSPASCGCVLLEFGRASAWAFGPSLRRQLLLALGLHVSAPLLARARIPLNHREWSQTIDREASWCLPKHRLKSGSQRPEQQSLQGR